jgi:Nitroreductase
MVIIERESCIGCGQCVNDCPVDNLTIRDGKAEVRKECLRCGHCVAICPTASVRIPEYDMEDVAEYDAASFRLPPEHVLNAIRFRRSTRHFEKKPVEQEKLEKILEAGRYSETAANRQGVRFAVVQDQLPEFRQLIWEGWKRTADSLRESNDPQAAWYTAMYRKYEKNPESDPLFFGAPVLLAVSADVPLDGGLASANMETMAVAQGLGALFSGMIEGAVKANPTAQEWLELGEKQLVSCILLGYPKYTYHRTAPRRRADILWK